MSQGISPGVCHVELPQELCGQLASRGDLEFTYGDQSFTLFDCKLASGHLAPARGGYLARVRLLDRRWRWKFGCISGNYNLRMAAGAPAAEGLDANAGHGVIPAALDASRRVRPGTEKSPQELAILCLEAMGETLYDVSALPNDPRPQVDWSYSNPAQALQSLCDGLGCRVVLGLADNRVRIVRHGEGSPLPQNAFVEFPSAGLRPAAAPGALLLVGGPSVFQGFLPLEPVGIDLDGSIRP